MSTFPTFSLAPNKMHFARSPRLPLTYIEYRGACRHHSLERDQLEYCDSTRELRGLGYELVREDHAIASSRIITRVNQELKDVFDRRSEYIVGSWVWLCHGLTAAQQAGEEDDKRVLKCKLSSSWTGPLKVKRVDPSGRAPHVKPVGNKFDLFGFAY